MQKPVLPPPSRLLFALLLGLITVGALLLRSLPLYDTVFTDEIVRLQGIDAHYHARLTKYVIEHYPDRLEHDPLRKFPSGQRVDVYPAYDLLNASVALAAGLGSPSDRTVDGVIAWLPPVLGALTSLVLGIAGLLLAGRWAGIAAALVAAGLPGGTFAQTLLGFADHHALESLLLGLSWLCLIVVFRAREHDRLFTSAWIVLGFLTASYGLTWEGGAVLPFTIAAAVGLFALITTDLRELGRMTIGAAAFAITGLALLMSAGFISHMIWIAGVLIGAVPFLAGLKLLTLRLAGRDRSGLSSAVWAAVIIGISAAVTSFLPGQVRETLLTNLGRLRPSMAAQTVSEMQPLISDPSLLYYYFGPALIWVPIQAAACVALYRRSREFSFLLPFVLGVIFLPAALMQIRFSASSSLAISLLSAAMVDWVWGSRSLLLTGRRWSGAPARGAILLLWVVSVPVWSLTQVSDIAATDRGPDPDWVKAAAWIRGHVPAPGSAPANAYGILNWWDSGYYLVSMAERPPFSNPTQSGASAAARLYLDTSAISSRIALQSNSLRYVLTDALITIVPASETSINGKFPALAVWAGRPAGEFFRLVHFQGPGGRLEPRFAYFPSYFRTLHSRLYLYGGKAAIPRPEKIWAIRTVIRNEPGIGPIELVESSMRFTSYDMARATVDAQPGLGWSIVSFSPFETCVPLEELTWITEVYASPTVAITSSSLPEPLPMIRMFGIVDTDLP